MKKYFKKKFTGTGHVLGSGDAPTEVRKRALSEEERLTVGRRSGNESTGAAGEARGEETEKGGAQGFADGASAAIGGDSTQCPAAVLSRCAWTTSQ